MSANGQQQAPPPRQIMELPPPFNHFEIQAHPDPNMVLLVIVDRTKNELHSYPMARKYAEELGRELTAPSIEVASVIPPNGKA
jgi:hypothetical protein